MNSQNRITLVSVLPKVETSSWEGVSRARMQVTLDSARDPTEEKSWANEDHDHIMALLYRVPNNSSGTSLAWLCATDETTLIYYLDAKAKAYCSSGQASRAF